MEVPCRGSESYNGSDQKSDPDDLQSAVYLMKWMEGNMRRKFEMLAVDMRQKIGIG
jgi:hypothetical protein